MFLRLRYDTIRNKQKKRRRINVKGILRIILICLGCFLIYVALGAILPFAVTKNKSGDLTHEIAAFYEPSNLKERAALVEENEDALITRLSMIEEAKKEIILSTFDIRTGKSTTDIFSALIAAADRGVKVKVYVDGMYGLIHMTGQTIFEAAGSHENLEIRYYNTPNLLMPWTINGRMHDKYLVVDDQMVLLGGRNTFDYFVGSYTPNSVGYDREVLIWQGEKDEKGVGAVAQVKTYFKENWDNSCSKTVFDKKKGKKIEEELESLRQHYKEMKENEKFPVSEDWQGRTVEIENAVLVTNPTHIMKKSPDVWYTMSELMKQAKENVIIQTPYAVFSKDMYKGIEEIAKTVPDTKMLINSTAVGDNVVASCDYTKNWKKVVGTGMPVYEYHGEHSCHGKSILIDDQLSAIGSYNFDMRSTYIDTETMLVINGKEFQKLLRKEVKKIEDESLLRKADGSYETDEAVEEKHLSTGGKVLYKVGSRIIQPFRYLV